MSALNLARAINGVTIKQRAIDGYIDATAMCTAYKKRFNDYRQGLATEEFLRALERNTGIQLFELVQSTRGRHTGGTWVHPRVAIHLAQWCSPEFAVLVTGWIEEWAGKPAFQKQVSAQAPQIAPVIEQIADNLEQRRLAELEHRVISLEFRRKAFSPATIRRVARVVHVCYGGKDPAGSGEMIADSRANFLPRIVELDHFNGNRMDNRIENCFPMHKTSHAEKTRCRDFSVEFQSFHNSRRLLEEREREREPDLFGRD